MSTAATTKTTASKKATTLPKEIFNVEVKNHELLKIAYNSYLAEMREIGARTKTRGLVSGGGKKPWRQKGTGRARTGSTRNPIWRGGGIVFGPTGNENYSLSLSTKQRRQALRQALSLANQEGIVKQVASIEFKEGKTKEATDFLKTHKAARTTLIVVAVKTPELIRATQNISQVRLISASHLTTYQVMNAFHIIIDSAGLEVLTERLKKETK